MISSVLALVAATAAAQATDTTRAARQAFTSCLREYVDRSAEASMAMEAFEAEYSRQCGQQEAAFRAAVIVREEAIRATRPNAEETANLEIEDARLNFRERFEMSITPEGASSD